MMVWAGQGTFDLHAHTTGSALTAWRGAVLALWMPSFWVGTFYGEGGDGAVCAGFFDSGPIFAPAVVTCVMLPAQHPYAPLLDFTIDAPPTHLIKQTHIHIHRRIDAALSPCAASSLPCCCCSQCRAVGCRPTRGCWWTTSAAPCHWRYVDSWVLLICRSSGLRLDGWLRAGGD